MEKDAKEAIIVAVVAVLIVTGGFVALFTYSGMSTPLTVVESGSMQHSPDRSSVGIIDTGDLVVMRDPSKTSITTFVEGYSSGYQKFGDYGDVIIYNRPNANPVIHRAIVWLDYLGDGKWSAPSLKNYAKWNVTEGDYNSMSGILTIDGLGWRRLPASINLDVLEPHSGYLTNGDNNHNGRITYFDQATGIAGHIGPIQKKDLKAVAGFEIPWLGCIKLLVNNTNVNQIPTNSVPCLAVMLVDIVFFFIVLSMVLSLIGECYTRNKEKGKK